MSFPLRYQGLVHIVWRDVINDGMGRPWVMFACGTTWVRRDQAVHARRAPTCLFCLAWAR